MIKLQLLEVSRAKPSIVIAQFATLAVALILPVLVEFGYMPFDAETLILTGMALLLSVLVALVAIRWPLVRPFLFLLGIYWFLDLYFIESGFVALLVTAALIAVAYSRFEAELRNVGTIFVGLFATISLIPPYEPVISPEIYSGATKKSLNPTLPLLIHVILDEHGSPLTASSRLKDTGRLDNIFDPYVKRGFAVHSWVRAPSDDTHISLGRIMAAPGTSEKENNYSREAGDFTYKLKKNSYIEALKNRGFEVSVIQSSFIQLCMNQNAECHTYPRDYYGHAMSRFTSSLEDRLWLAVALLHSKQYSPNSVRHVIFYGMIGGLLRTYGGLPTKMSDWTRPAFVLDVLDSIERRALSMHRGEAYLVHLLAPHFPYVLDSKCNMRPRNLWREPPWFRKGKKMDGGLAAVEEAYWQQAECMHARLLSVIDNAERAVGRDGVVVVLHGDHGTRVVNYRSGPKAEKLTIDKASAMHDTIVLMRGPGIEPIQNNELVFLDEVLRNVSKKYLMP